MEIYVNNILVKHFQAEQYMVDLEETFQILRKYHLKLNSSKCDFGVASKKFLGFMVTHHGIEVNSKKFRAILEMSLSKTRKEV